MTRKQLSAIGAALICGLLAARGAQAAPYYTTVDTQLGTGFMAITAYGGAYNGAGAWNINITATDTSNTIPYKNVDLSLQFIYPGNANGNAIGNGFAYNTGTQTWNDGLGDSLVYTAASVPLTGMLMSNSNAPDTWLSSGFPASVAPTDTVPLLQLGNFAPLQNDNFTLVATQPTGAPFLFVSVGFFVVPEPGSMALIASGAALLLLSKFRRRRTAIS